MQVIRAEEERKWQGPEMHVIRADVERNIARIANAVQVTIYLLVSSSVY